MNNHLKLVMDFLVSLRSRGAQCLLAFCALVFLVSCNKDDGNGTLPPAGNPADENVPSQHTCGTPNVHNPNLNYGSMTDQEGNVYKTIVIGTQEWMAENLNTSTYRNGDEIQTNSLNLDSADLQNTTIGTWSYYNNDENYACPFGKLYSWFACVDDRQLCPAGWHVPSDEESGLLIDFLGGEIVAGGKMKSAGTIEAATGLWKSPNINATNSSGFSGIPGSYSNNSGFYYGLNSYGDWWSSSELNSTDAWYFTLDYGITNAERYFRKKHNGLSVRCIRD